MKDINEWFTSQDWLNLTTPLTDRRIILTQIVVYQDTSGQQLFAVDIPGVLLRDSRGISPFPHASITSFDSGAHSNAEYHERGENAAFGHHSAWDEFTNWYLANKI
jgi:hypothetical protein